MAGRIKNRTLVLLGVAALIVAAGGGGLAGFGFWMLFGKPPTPYLMPGTEAVVLAEPGEYMIAYETRSVVDGQAIISPPSPPSFELSLRDPNGAPLTVRAPSSNYTYTIGGRAGQMLYEFTAPAAGRYELEATAKGTDGGRPFHDGSPPFVLAVGQEHFWPAFTRIFGGMCALLACGAVGVILLLIALGRWFEERDRRKRESRSPG